MARKKKPLPLFEDITISDVAAEGKSLVRITIPEHDGTPESQLVVFVPWCVPGDIVDLQIKKRKHNYAEAEVVRFKKLSDTRAVPFCKHFGTCGGCKWQNLPYEDQLKFKQQQVYDQLRRIGHLDIPVPSTTSEDGKTEFRQILGSVKTRHYRNKLEFGASNKRYLSKEEIASLPHPADDKTGALESAKNTPSLGFHITGAFDKILPITECHLMDSLQNDIRNEICRYAIEHGISFFDLREQTGLLRDIILRNSNSGEWMLIVQFHFTTTEEIANDDDTLATVRHREQEQAMGLLQHIADKFPEITSLLWVDNPKRNDTFHDLPVNVFHGNDHIFEHMEDLRFKVGPKSFYQTNTEQAYHLYRVARELAFAEEEKLPHTDSPLIYDLYTGTGTIANFVARRARQVIGIEYVPEAIEDAKVNSDLNKIDNTLFYAGDMKDILNDEFISRHGRPDVIITDPPRAGMHPDVVQTIIKAAPQRIVYVSCNPATQARDLEMLCQDYCIRVVQPVDMFPHTPHVENVVMLEKKDFHNK